MKEKTNGPAPPNSVSLALRLRCKRQFSHLLRLPKDGPANEQGGTEARTSSSQGGPQGGPRQNEHVQQIPLILSGISSLPTITAAGLDRRYIRNDSEMKKMVEEEFEKLQIGQQIYDLRKTGWHVLVCDNRSKSNRTRCHLSVRFSNILKLESLDHNTNLTSRRDLQSLV